MIIKCYRIVPENVKQPWKQFENELRKRRRVLKDSPLAKCKAIVVVCPVVSQAGKDITAALQTLSETDAGKPAVLVVLHHTFDPERTVSDSSRDVNRPNTLTVDCLFHEDRGLLQCRKNDEALGDVAAWLKHVVKYQSFQPFAVQTERGDAAWGETSRTDNLPQLKLRLGKLNFVKCVTGKTLGSHMDFVRILCKRRAELQEVHAVEECDVILAFCPVVSVAGIDTKNALEQLNDVSGSKPAVLVVLHHTFDPELIVPDSSRSVNREETLTVDCLFHEDKGLLRCRKNDEALSRVSEWIETQGSYYQ